MLGLKACTEFLKVINSGSVSHHWVKHKEAMRRKGGLYLNTDATGTQREGLRDRQWPGQDLQEVAAKGTGPEGACEERPVRRQKLLGRKGTRFSKEGTWSLTQDFPLQEAPQDCLSPEPHVLWVSSSARGWTWKEAQRLNCFLLSTSTDCSTSLRPILTHCH